MPTPMTNLQANWTTVKHGATSILKVQSCMFSQGGTLESYSADGDHYPTTVVNLMNRPRASVTSGDIGNLLGFTTGTVGTFTATHKDAKGTVGGDLVYTMINAVVENVEGTGTHAAIGSGTMTMLAFSTDGTTNPLSIARS